MNDAQFVGHMNIRASREQGTNGKEVRRIRGVASTSGVKRDGHFLDMKSLAKAAKLFDRRQGKIFWNHTWAIPIGVREALTMVENDLHFSGIIGHGFPVPVAVGPLGMPVLMGVDDLWNIMEQELTTSLSIAFGADPVMDKKTGERTGELTVTDLFEVSVVTIPADPEAEFKITRAMDDAVYARAFRAEARELRREELYGLGLDGAAAAAAVDMDGAREDDGRDPLEELEGPATGEWARVREELETCRKSLRTTF